MTGDEAVKHLEKRLDDVLADLLRDSRGSRTTVRIDDKARGWDVDFVCGEALRPGVNSMRGNGSIAQREASTVHWMDANKRILVQPDVVNGADPAPPPALISGYGAKAQMLGPLFNADGYLQGWISVHYTDGPHNFTDEEIAALAKAQAEIKAIAGI